MPWHKPKSTTDVLTFVNEHNQERREGGGFGVLGGKAMGEAQNWADSDMLVGKNTI